MANTASETILGIFVRNGPFVDADGIEVTQDGNLIITTLPGIGIVIHSEIAPNNQGLTSIQINRRRIHTLEAGPSVLLDYGPTDGEQRQPRGTYDKTEPFSVLIPIGRNHNIGLNLHHNCEDQIIRVGWVKPMIA
jgi:hypothetical protein